MPAKYIFVNGVMKKNPEYKEQVSTVANPDEALAIVSSTNDFQQANEAVGQEIKTAPATITAMTTMQDPSYLQKFATEVDGGDLLDGLYTFFEKHEVPVGLVNKLMTLTEYDKLDFIIDDSGSMAESTDVTIAESTDYVRKNALTSRLRDINSKMTRWEEVEDRLHVLMDILAYLPIKMIRIHFLNRRTELKLSHLGRTPDQFSQEAHREISNAFRNRPSSTTPMHTILTEAFNLPGKVMHYLFTDGVPDEGVEKIGDLVQYRKNPDRHPLTFMSCTDNDGDAAWMKDVEEKGPMTAELDDFKSERAEVLKKQGAAFPFSRGLWLLCQLVAAINPDDLDALDEKVPFSRHTMNNLMGRELSPQEYTWYFNKHPEALQYGHLFQRLLNETGTAKQIMSGTVAPAPLSGFALGMFGPGEVIPPPPPAAPHQQEYGLSSGYRR